MSDVMRAISTSPTVMDAITVPLDHEVAEEVQVSGPARGLLGQQLLGAGLISADQLADALEHQAKKELRLGEALLDLGFILEEELFPFIEAHTGVESVRLREGLIDTNSLECLSRENAERYRSLPMFRVRDVLTVATDDPQNLQRIDDLERITGLDISPIFASRRSVERMIARAYQEDFAVDSVTADMDESAIELQTDIVEADLSQVVQLADGSPVVNLVNYLILEAVRKGVSDIHIEPGKQFTTVRYRIDGQLVEVLRPRRDLHPAVASRIKVMAKLDIAEQRAPQDGRCQVMVEGKQIDLRVSTMPTVLGEKVVLRVLDRQRLTLDLNRLGIPDDALRDIKTLLRRPHGLLLVTGPTGSGKTTTLYSALELIKSVHNNIVTVEDPVEYQIEMVNQVQVNQARSVDFASALRAILRQDPDIIMIGEIRDAETAQVAVRAALTGHLVLSTLHTNDSIGAITRMIDMGTEPYHLAAAFVGVISQRLVRTICPKCRTTYFPSDTYLDLVHYQGDRQRAFTKGEGCRECFDTGFQGRTGIYEVLKVTDELRQMIATGTDLETARRWFAEQGGRSLLENGLELAEQGITSLEETARVALFD